MSELILPTLRDGVAQGDVLKVLVKVGDTLALDQSVLELETDKATIEVPSDVAGKITAIKVKAGDKVKPGQAVLTLDSNGSTGSTGSKGDAPKQEAAKQEAPKSDASKQEAPKQEAAPAPEGEEPAAAPERPRASVTNIAAGRPQQPAAPAPAPPPVAQSHVTSAPAAPSVRRLAREIGVDVTQVPGSGPGGRITQDDVKEFAKRVMNSLGSNGQAAASAGGPRANMVGPALPDFAKWGEIER